LVIECNDDAGSISSVRDQLLQCLTQQVVEELELVVPLEVKFSVGHRWGEMNAFTA
jgi:hypothetical protein